MRNGVCKEADKWTYSDCGGNTDTKETQMQGNQRHRGRDLFKEHGRNKGRGNEL